MPRFRSLIYSRLDARLAANFLEQLRAILPQLGEGLRIAGQRLQLLNDLGPLANLGAADLTESLSSHDAAVAFAGLGDLHLAHAGFGAESLKVRVGSHINLH